MSREFFGILSISTAFSMQLINPRDPQCQRARRKRSTNRRSSACNCDSAEIDHNINGWFIKENLNRCKRVNLAARWGGTYEIRWNRFICDDVTTTSTDANTNEYQQKKRLTFHLSLRIGGFPKIYLWEENPLS